MDLAGKEKKNLKRGLITKTWERCKSIGRGSHPSFVDTRRLTKKSKSWHGRSDGGGSNTHKDKHKPRVAPEGCFSVYVGPEKQRFVIKTEYANHPFFSMLLEEAETEYGYSSAGPLELPCGVDVFCKVLMEIESDDGVGGPRRGCAFAHRGMGGFGAYRLLSPSGMLAINQF